MTRYWLEIDGEGVGMGRAKLGTSLTREEALEVIMEAYERLRLRADSLPPYLSPEERQVRQAAIRRKPFG